MVLLKPFFPIEKAVEMLKSPALRRSYLEAHMDACARNQFFVVLLFVRTRIDVLALVGKVCIFRVVHATLVVLADIFIVFIHVAWNLPVCISY